MNLRHLSLLLLCFGVLQGCDHPTAGRELSRDPVSVRGWIVDVDHPTDGVYRTVETENARRLQLFQQTTIWVEGAPFVSGGVAENGSFLLLDVPPGRINVTFRAPGLQDAHLILEDIPGNADVFVPSLLLKPGVATPTEPTQVRVRMAASIPKAIALAKKARVGGVACPIMQTPIIEMNDRHDYPFPDAPSGAPVATVK